MVPSSPSGPSSFEDQCKRDTQRRRQERRKQCVAFIKVPVRAHKKKLCATDAVEYFMRKLGRRAKADIIRELERAGVPSWLLRKPRRPRLKIPDIKVGGGVEIDVDDIIKGVAQG